MTTHLALVGPTASGKSALALHVAGELGDVEIVSVDSMQVYRGLDIGTAKATPDERTRVVHHMIDVADPGESWSAARYQADARAAISDIEGRGRRALLVGGTGLYVRAVLDQLEFPGEDVAVRVELEREAEQHGAPALHAKLARVDPAAASRIEATNIRRIVRALEVHRITGRPFSSFGSGLGGPLPFVVPVRLAGVWLPREVVSERIARRVHEMLADGLVDEVRNVLARGSLSRTARQAIGYREVLAFLDGEIPTMTDLHEAIVRRTKAFSRRQRMWFRRDPRVAWFAAAEDPDRLVPAFLAAWG